MEIRKGKLDDLTELQKNFVRARDLSVYSFNSNYMYIVEDDNKIIAFLYGDKTENSGAGILLELEVLQDYRNKKIATNLIKRFEEDLKQENCNGILVFYSFDENLYKFYNKIGFKNKDTLLAGLKEIK
ncbi:MAG: GNAT family N-acetyltransferase [Clostridia bacterium]|nr:GNAT family N-acetyltransferase [Clostridia bacterium]